MAPGQAQLARRLPSIGASVDHRAGPMFFDPTGTGAMSPRASDGERLLILSGLLTHSVVDNTIDTASFSSDTFVVSSSGPGAYGVDSMWLRYRFPFDFH